MTIATSVYVRPSLLVKSSAFAFSMILAFVGIFIARLDFPNFPLHYFLSPLCFIAAWRCFAYFLKVRTKIWHIVIDGQGQLRLNPVSVIYEYQNTQQSLNGYTYNLASGTVFWSQVLFLRLYNNQDNIVINLVITSDALTKHEFCQLSTACRWIYRHRSSRPL